MKTFNDNVIAEIDAADFGNVEIRTNGGPGSNKFGFGWTAPEDFARREQDGPILSGPYLYGYGLCTSLHNGPVTADVPKLFVRTGDVIKVRNLVKRGHLRTFYFVATVCTRGYVSFEFVEAYDDNFATLSAGQRGGRKMNCEVTEMSKADYSVYLKEQFDAKRA